jgi:hypothetical protein
LFLNLVKVFENLDKVCVRAQCLSSSSATYFRVRKPIGRLGGFWRGSGFVLELLDSYPVECPIFCEVLLSNGNVLGAAGMDGCIFKLTSSERIVV